MATENRQGLLSEVAEERKFLHDISSPLAAVMFLVDSALANAKGAPVPQAGVVDRLEKALEAMGKVKDLIHDRRATLIERSEDQAA